MTCAMSLFAKILLNSVEFFGMHKYILEECAMIINGAEYKIVICASVTCIHMQVCLILDGATDTSIADS